MPYDSQGNEVDELPGPGGSRMAQLGMLTRAQKKKPELPGVDMNKEGKANPGDLENVKFQASLADKAYQLMQQRKANGPSNTVSEADPMKTSMVRRTQMMKR